MGEMPAVFILEVFDVDRFTIHQNKYTYAENWLSAHLQPVVEFSLYYIRRFVRLIHLIWCFKLSQNGRQRIAFFV